MVDCLNGSSVAGDFGAQVPATLPDGTRGTVQDILNALAKQTDDHKRDKDNPHEVTAEQVGAYTKEETKNAITDAVSNAVAGEVPALTDAEVAEALGQI